MCLSLVFIFVDLLSVTPVLAIGGINPFWKFALVFKCLTDTIILDDFKTALDKLSRHKMSQIYQLPFSIRSGELRPRGMQVDGRVGDAVSCNGSADMVSIEQIERVSSDADLSISTADAVPYPPPIASNHEIMGAGRKGNDGKKESTITHSLCVRCASSLPRENKIYQDI